MHLGDIMEEYFFISFDSTNNAMGAEDYLKRNNYSITILPTPREVSASCGLSIRFNSGGLDQIKDAVKSGSLKVKGIYSLKSDNGRRVVEKIG